MKKPKIAAPSSVQFGDGGLVRQTRVYEVITPIFGGGTEAGVPDADFPVNGKTIRGQLRFWWRVMRAGNNKTLEELFDIESAIWGAAANEERKKKGIGPSEVQIVVQVLQAGKLESPFTINQRGRTVASEGWEDLAYFAFPLQPDSRKDKAAGEVLDGVDFQLQITFRETDRAEVEAALWAWETFGGVGGRTRRGFGALRLVSLKENEKTLPISLPKNEGEAPQWLGAHFQKHSLTGKYPDGIGQLRGLQVKFENSGWNVWCDLAFYYKKFRQQREGNTRGAGRQLWPEPDAIRVLSRRHFRPYAPKSNNCGKFPRGQFGLPVVFHFKDERDGDPGDFSLELPGFERLASPLILKPLACEGNHSVGLAARLKTQFPGEPFAATLKPIGRHSQNFPVSLGVSPHEATGIEPLKTQNTTDVIGAFLKYLQSQNS